MANRKRPLLVATRVNVRERAAIELAAQLEGVKVAQLLRRIVLPAVGERVGRMAQEIGAGETPPKAA